MKPNHLPIMLLALFILNCCNANAAEVNRFPIGLAYANDALNADVFRVSALASANGFQFVTYYAPDGRVVVGRRKLGETSWDLAVQDFRGNVRDAHNDVVLGISSDGIVHLSYDHHGSLLHYRISQAPYDIHHFSKLLPMTSQTERRVTYPQFLAGPEGNFYFFYRDGSSGNGSLCVNRYDAKSKKWSIVAHPLIDGEHRCNPYWWRPAFGKDGSIHLAWCWRDTGRVETNHDICYARSNDGGRTWLRSDGSKQIIPITRKNAEVVMRIARGSNLINQCSSAVDRAGRPHLAEYFNDSTGIPQYFDVWFDGKKWHKSQVSQRTGKFSLSGGGSLAIPLSRPEIAAAPDGTIVLIARDADAGGGIRLFKSNSTFTHWQVIDLLKENLADWEPSYDLARLRNDGVLSLFVLAVKQGNHERTTHFGPQQASVVETPLP